MIIGALYYAGGAEYAFNKNWSAVAQVSGVSNSKSNPAMQQIISPDFPVNPALMMFSAGVEYSFVD